MSKVAFSEIRHGKDDGEVLVIKEGEPVKGLSKEVMLELEAAGAIGEEPMASSEVQADLAAVESERDDLQDQVQKLQQELAQAKLDAADKPPAK